MRTDKVILNLGFFLTFFLFITLNNYWVPELEGPALLIACSTSIYYVLFGGKVSKYASLVAVVVAIFYFLVQLSQARGIYGFVAVFVALVFGHLISSGLINKRVSLILLISVFFSISYKVVLGVILEGGYTAILLNNVVLSGSRNVISQNVIILVTIYYLTSYFNREARNPEIWPALLSFGFCIFAISRSGILSSFLLALLIICARLYRKWTFNIIQAFIPIILIILSFIIYFIVLDGATINTIFDLIEKVEFYSYSGNIRSTVLRDYFDAFEAQNLLLGFDSSKVKIIAWFGNNTHNSYLSFLSNAGLGSVLFFLFLFIKELELTFNGKGFLALLLVPVMVRFITDQGLFLTIYDCVFYAVLSAPARVRPFKKQLQSKWFI